MQRRAGCYVYEAHLSTRQARDGAEAAVLGEVLRVGRTMSNILPEEADMCRASPQLS